MSKYFHRSGAAANGVVEEDRVHRTSTGAPSSTPGATENGDKPKGPIIGNLSDILGDSGVSGMKNHMTCSHSSQLIKGNRGRRAIYHQRFTTPNQFHLSCLPHL
jgi:hypothetical protein